MALWSPLTMVRSTSHYRQTKMEIANKHGMQPIGLHAKTLHILKLKIYIYYIVYILNEIIFNIILYYMIISNYVK